MRRRQPPQPRLRLRIRFQQFKHRAQFVTQTRQEAKTQSSLKGTPSTRSAIDRTKHADQVLGVPMKKQAFLVSMFSILINAVAFSPVDGTAREVLSRF
jgi:hypothetical protein